MISKLPQIPSLKGLRIVVTGGSQGIGEAIVARLAAEGAQVWITDLADKKQQAEELIKALPGCDVHWRAVDVASEQSVTEAIAEISEQGHIWGLVNNAGTVGVGGFLETAIEDLVRQIEINLNGSWRVAQAVLPNMVEHGGGSIVQIASLGSLLAPKQRAAYAASKHAVLALPRVIAAEFSTKGVRANAICPNRVATEAAMERARASEGQWKDMHLTQASLQMIPPCTIAELVRTCLLPNMIGLNGEILTVSDGALCTLRSENEGCGVIPPYPG